MIYKIYFANSGVGTSGLTLSWEILNKVSDGTAYTPQPTFSDIGGGWYKTNDVTFTEAVIGVIDGGASLTSNSDRYVPFDAGTTDAYLDVAVSTRVSATDTRLNNLDATISSRLATSAYTAPDNANIVLTESALASVSANIPLTESAIAAVSANLDTTISSRLPTSSYVAPDNVSIALTESALASVSANIPLTETAVAAISGNMDAKVSTRLATSAYTIPDNSDITSIWIRVNANLDEKVSTRLPTSGYTAPDNADIVLIKSSVQSTSGNLDTTISSRASQTSNDAIYNTVTNLSGNTAGRLIAPTQIIIPGPSATYFYNIDFFLYSASGTLVSPDSAPILHVTDTDGTNFDTYLDTLGGAMTYITTGHYKSVLSVPWTLSPTGLPGDLTEFNFDATWTLSSVPYAVHAVSVNIEESHLSFGQADRDKIEATYNKLPLGQIADETSATNNYNLLSNQVTNIPSVASRVVTSLPSSIVRAASGDQYVSVEVLLYDQSGALFTSKDSDTSATSAVYNYDGFGVKATDANGNSWTLYKDTSGTPLDTIQICHHAPSATSVFPQVLEWVSNGVYNFWMNVTSATMLGSFTFLFAWFDKGQSEPGFSISDHKKEVRQMSVTDNTTLGAIKAQTDKLVFSGSYVESAPQIPVVLTSAYDAAMSAASQASVNAIPTTPLLSTDSRLNHLDSDISTRLATSGYTAPDNANIVKTESAVAATSANLDTTISSRLSATDSRLNYLDALISSRLATSGYTAPSNSDISDIRSKVDAYLDATISSRFASSAYTAPSNADITAIRSKTDAYLDATVTSRLASAGYTAPDNATILAISGATDVLHTIVTDLQDEALGKWVLDPTAKTLTLYRQDGITVLKVFDLSFSGKPALAYDVKVPR